MILGTLVTIAFFWLLGILPVGNWTLIILLAFLAAATYRNAASMVLRIPLYITLILLVEIFKISFVIAASSLIMIIFLMLLLNSKINNLQVVIQN